MSTDNFIDWLVVEWVGKDFVLFFHFSFCLAPFECSWCPLVCFSFILHALALFFFYNIYFFKCLSENYLVSEVSYSNFFLAQKNLWNAWIAISKLRDSVTSKRMKLQWLRRKLKLTSILKGQVRFLIPFSLQY